MIRVPNTAGRACRDPFRALLTAAALAPIAAWLTAEGLHAWAERREPLVEPVETLAPPPVELVETLLVLGYPSEPDGTTSLLQRWRVDLAARNARPTTLFVISGANEAGIMAADLIARHGVRRDRVTCENEATTTWENVANSAALIAPGGVVRFISDPLHARRAERYWRLQHPERAGELRAARLYRFGEHPVLKMLTASYSVVLRTLRYRPAGNRIWQRVEANR